MIIPASVNQKIDLVKPYVAMVESRVREQLQRYCDDQGFAFLGRSKERESLAEKLETGRYKKWSDLDDMYACAIIVPTITYEKHALDYLSSHYDCVAVRKRGSTKKDPSVFRFDATRFIGSLGDQSGLDASSPVRTVSFEVQVRTAFEHAWQVATHALVYKGDSIDWRRLRLAAQLKASVEQLDALAYGFLTIADTLPEHEWAEVSAKSDVEKFFRRAFDEGSLRDEASPSSWMRFCDNYYTVVLASAKEHVRNRQERVNASLEIVDDYLKEHSPPFSLTLLQFCLGVLADGGFLTAPLHKYTPLLTDELITLFPATKVLGRGIDLELSSDG